MGEYADVRRLPRDPGLADPSMRAIAGSLSDEDILNLAAYYSRGLARTASK